MWTVLVVDDEPFVRVAMASLKDWRLRGYDFRFEAGNGHQALDLIQTHPEIDMVLLDLSMPGMDGIGVLEALAQEARAGGRRSPAVIVLSARDDFPLVRKAFHLGVRDYLLKTEVDGDSLGAILDRVSQELTRRPEGGEHSGPDADARVAQSLLQVLQGPPGDPTSWTGPELTFPVTLWAVVIWDFDTLAGRLSAEELSRFLDLFLRSIRQLLARRGGGWVVAPERNVAAVVTGPSVEDGLFGPELKESLERYLSVRIEVERRPGLERLEDLRPGWDALGASRSGASRIVLATRRYLREHFTQPVISLDELAAHVGVSRNHLSWEFTRETGETITDHLARIRVEQACKLLATTTWKVYEIAEKVGYTNVEHFSRVFKRVTGTSPNRWAGSDGPKVFRDIHQ